MHSPFCAYCSHISGILIYINAPCKVFKFISIFSSVQTHLRGPKFRVCLDVIIALNKERDEQKGLSPVPPLERCLLLSARLSDDWI